MCRTRRFGKGMMNSLRKIRRCRVIPVVLAVAWLPYVGTRCIANPFAPAGCCVRSVANHAHGGHAGGPSDATATLATSHQGADHTRGPAHSCFDLSGTCAIQATSPAPPANASGFSAPSTHSDAAARSTGAITPARPLDAGCRVWPAGLPLQPHPPYLASPLNSTRAGLRPT